MPSEAPRLPAGSLPLPPELGAMADEVPACFDRAGWVMWLSDTWHKPLDNAAERGAMRRGIVPDYCAECTRAYRVEMAEHGRCERAAGLLKKGTPCKTK